MRLRVWNPELAQIEADLDRFYALDQRCFAPGIAYTREELAAFLAHPSAFSVLLEDRPIPATPQGELLGFAIARTFLSRGKAVLHIITIDVSPTARRRGVGSMLMEWMASKAHDLNLKTLRLEVSVDNAEALAFYQRLGFTQVGRIAGYYLGALDALVLERTLGRRRSQ